MKKLKLFIIIINTFLFQEIYGNFTPNYKINGSMHVNYYHQILYGEQYKYLKNDVVVPNVKNRLNIAKIRLEHRYHFSPNWSSRIALEPSNTGSDDKNWVYVQYASIHYKIEQLKINVGLLSTYATSLQQKLNQHRYLLKAFNHEYNFGKSTQFGIQGQYQINTSLTIDAGVFNGKGYDKNQSDSTYKYAFGATVKTPKNIFVRIYTDIQTFDTATITFLGILGFQNEQISLGTEFNYQANQDGINQQNRYGTSVYMNFKLNEKYKIITRHDYIVSNTTDLPNNSNGKMTMIAFEYTAAKGIKITPNLRIFRNTSTQQTIPVALLNLGLKF